MWKKRTEAPRHADSHAQKRRSWYRSSKIPFEFLLGERNGEGTYVRLVWSRGVSESIYRYTFDQSTLVRMWAPSTLERGPLRARKLSRALGNHGCLFSPTPVVVIPLNIPAMLTQIFTPRSSHLSVTEKIFSEEIMKNLLLTSCVHRPLFSLLISILILSIYQQTTRPDVHTTGNCPSTPTFFRILWNQQMNRLK